MNRSTFTAMAVIAVIGTAISPTTAGAGHNDAVGAGLLGLGIGAIVGSALTPREVYVVPPPPPPPPAYYGPVGYAPRALEPGLVQILPWDVWTFLQSPNRLFSSG